jgi:hypothetical protein
VRNESGRPLTVNFMGAVHQWNPATERPKHGLDATGPHCQLCGSEIHDCYFVPCAHAVFCRRCWDGLPEKPTDCELCLIPIDDICAPLDCSNAEDGVGICSICYAAQSDSIMVPCGHALCHNCGVEWLKGHIDCPFCRAANANVRWNVCYH